MTTPGKPKSKGISKSQESMENPRGTPTREVQNLSADDVQRLIHDLETHHVELEMQNEELRRAQQESLDYHHRYMDLYDYAPLGYVTLDLHGTILEMNLTGAKLLGVERRALLGHPLVGYVAQADRKAFRSQVRRCTLEREDVISEVVLEAKDGRVINAQLHGIPEQRLEDGATLCRCAITDITERKQAERLVRQSGVFLQTVIDAVPELTLVIDRDHRVLLANRAAREMVGGADPVAACLTCHELPRNRQPRCQKEIEPCPLRQVLETKRPVLVEHARYDRDNNEMCVEMSAAPIFDEAGEVVQIVQVSRDITDRKQAEETLRREKDISEATLKSLPGVFYAFNERGNFLRWNTNFEEMSGYAAEEILRMHPLDFIGPQHRESVADRIQEVFAVGEAVVEASFLTRDGRELPFHFTGVRCEIDGKPCLLGTGLDISERKHAEESLQKSEQRFRSLVETTSDWIWEVDQDGVYTYASPKVKELLGYEPEEIVGTSAFDLMLPEEAVRVGGLFRRACESGRSFSQLANTNVRKDGRPVVLETSGVPIFDRDGNVRGYRGVDRDVTERKMAGEALRRSEEKYRVLFEQSADATLIIEGNKFIDCNDAVVEMLRYRNKADLLRTHPSELSPEKQPDGTPSYEKANELMAIAFEKGSHRFEWDHKRADGEVFPVEVLLTAIPSEDSKILHVVWRDITDRKRAEKEREDLIAKLEAQNAELERFTYTVSHDLKSPLITVKGFLGVLKEDLTVGDAKAIADDMARMSSAADKMGQLLNELLELSRIGRVVNPLEDVSLGEIAQEAVELVQGRITQEGILVEVAADMPILFGDRFRLVEVLQNLIENAVKCTAAQANPHIEIGARQDNHETVCYVRDNGMGIHPRYHERVFNLFEKLDPKSEGTGVGLALVKRIIEVHGGRIWVESEGVGQGSAFCFTLPPKSDRAG